jgi:MarR family transcriptional regulator, organic hydroperoxide resistance regulator
MEKKTARIPTKDLERRLIVLLRNTSDIVVKARNRELRKNGISLEEWGVLSVVNSIAENNCQQTPAEISRWLFREHHSVTTLLNRMAKKGLIKTTKDLERKNLVRVTLTDKGEKIFQAGTKANVHERIVSGLSVEEQKQLVRFLYTLRAEAQKELGIENTPPFP